MHLNSLRLENWPLRVKMAAFLVAAALGPLLVSSWADIKEAREEKLQEAASLLASRGDELANRLDTFNEGRRHSVDHLAQLVAIKEYCQTDAEDGAHRLRVLASLMTWPYDDPSTYAMAILSPTGRVRVSTVAGLDNVQVSGHLNLGDTSQRSSSISELHFLGSKAGDVPALAFFAAVRDAENKVVGFVVRWLLAQALWNEMKVINGDAVPSSFAVLYDKTGIRIGHTDTDDSVFHPAGKLAEATANTMVARNRFGRRTRELLDDVRHYPAQYERATAGSLDSSMFLGRSLSSQQEDYGVGRRFKTVPWTVFYMLPHRTVHEQVERVTWREAIETAAGLLAVLVAGLLFGTPIVTSIRALSRATESVARGDLSARAPSKGHDELGRLGTSFNTMAEQIQRQTLALEQARDDLQKKAAALLESNNELEAFARSVAHDLRNPLNGIIGLSELMILRSPQSEPKGEQQQFVEQIHETGLQMNALIGDLLRLSRLSHCEMQFGRVDLSALADEIAQRLALASPSRVVDFEIEQGVIVDGDEGLLRVMLENLIGNAWKYSSKAERSHIRFSTAPGPSSSVVYSVRDNGAGFDMSRAERLFEPFYRLHSDAEFSGTGIGLSIVRRIVHRHGGRVWAESSIGKGATLSFTLNEQAIDSAPVA